MNDYLSVRGTKDFARISPEECSQARISNRGYHQRPRGTASQISTMISRYLCDGLKSKCWDCECRVQCEYGKRYMALLRQREADAGRPWVGYKAALKPELDAYKAKMAIWHQRLSTRHKGNKYRQEGERRRHAENHGQV